MNNIDVLKQHLLANYTEEQPFSFLTLTRNQSRKLKLDNKQISGCLSAMAEQNLLKGTGKTIVNGRSRSVEYTIDANAIRASLAERDKIAARTIKSSEYYIEQVDLRLRQIGEALDRVQKAFDAITRNRSSMGASA